MKDDSLESASQRSRYALFAGVIRRQLLSRTTSSYGTALRDIKAKSMGRTGGGTRLALVCDDQPMRRVERRTIQRR